MPQLDLSRWGPLTVLVVTLVVVFATAGAVVAIVHPASLSFEQLASDVTKFVLGLGVLGVGHGIASTVSDGPGDPDSIPEAPVPTAAIPTDGNDQATRP